MLRQQVGTTADRSSADPRVFDRQRPSAVDAVHVRNYDHADGHSVHVTVQGADGRVQLTERSYLAPGQSRRLTATIEPGTYLVRVRVDGVDRTAGECRLDGSPARTAVVELGNGVVSLIEGADDLVTA